MEVQEVRDKLCVALDTPDLERALELVRMLAPMVSTFKIGQTLFLAHGPVAVQRLKGLGVNVFLDVKLHDIPAQVSGAVRAAFEMGVDYLTLHASGGEAMLRAAKDAARSLGGRPKLLGVTLLTSLDSSDTELLFGESSPARVVEKLLGLCVSTGLCGAVLSTMELYLARKLAPRDFLLVTPAIASPKSKRLFSKDQKRTGTLQRALEKGADMVVLGRAVTRSKDPAKALERLLEE